VCRYKWRDAKGQEQVSEHRVDAEDQMWRELRHSHIADVGSAAAARLKEFANSKLARVEREGAWLSEFPGYVLRMCSYAPNPSFSSMTCTLQ
jgi:hypothetical protein